MATRSVGGMGWGEGGPDAGGGKACAGGGLDPPATSPSVSFQPCRVLYRALVYTTYTKYPDNSENRET